MKREFSLAVVFLALGLVFGFVYTTPATADNLYASIRGVVTDPSGAVLSGVQVRLTNVDTGIVKEMASDSSGSFLFVGLRPGRYDLAASKVNFKIFEARGIRRRWKRPVSSWGLRCRERWFEIFPH
jgi:hypothetical protein